MNPLPYGEVFTILEGAAGQGQYVGTYMAWGVNNSGWWGEGEIKFYLDGEDWPTIVGTGTEDYFCGGYNFDPGRWELGRARVYQEFNTPYAGMPQFFGPMGCIVRRRGLGCIAGTFPIRSVLRAA